MFICSKCLPRHVEDVSFVEIVCLTSGGGCEDCGKVGRCYDVPPSWQKKSTTPTKRSDAEGQT